MEKLFEDFRNAFGKNKAKQDDDELDSDHQFGPGRENKEQLAQRLIKSIVRVYAISPEVRVRFSKDVQLAPEEKAVLQDSLAVYVFEDNKKDPLFKSIIINSDEFGKDIRQDIKVLLHEVRHFNQHQFWLSASPEQRLNYIGKNPLPPILEKMKVNPDRLKKTLQNFPLWKLHSFWVNLLGIDEAPHEKDAWEFANKHFKQALYDNVDASDLKILRGINHLEEEV